MVVSMVLWGVSWPSSGILSKFGSPTALGLWRYFFVILSLLLLLLLTKTPIKIIKKGIIPVCFAGILMASYNYSFLKGLQLGNPGAGGILVTTLNPLFAFLIGLIVDWRKPSLKESIGLLLGLIAGVTLLQLWNGTAILFKAGNLLFLASALLWAVASKITSKAANFGSPFAFSWWLYVVTFICLIPISDIHETIELMKETSIYFWGNLLFGSIIVTTLATTVYFYATSKIGAEKASSFIFTVPFTAAISSFLILNEQIHWYTIVGGILGIAAVYVINMKSKKQNLEK
jgi:drug/metabolite transporter (DMT)-like permease